MIFVSRVKKSFDRLLDEHGIFCISSDGCLVHYAGNGVFIDVTFDQKYSYEVNLYFGETSQADDEVSFTIGELLRLKFVENKELYRGFQASTQHSLDYSVKRLAELLRKYGEEVLKNESEIFLKLTEHRKYECYQYATEQELKFIRQDAERAWQNKDYRKVVDLYKSVENKIKPSEMKKLKYAKKQMDV